ncbi:hypothetical protein [Hymenobacter properus]|uniref:Uncharacterized protein n=1 Tax=Hymenobacter properus TaxID=2791026 RepID=A0A931BCC2_9BACT|nr:hypothetical protein [Hymenobacter properus]MBF9140001.1 hypothetical protein [Hymenobacter properus]MBR7718808.1 hypothetical protein [Microvirga sp. SRT04]
MQQLPTALPFAFGLIALLTIACFYRAAHYSRRTLAVLLAWLGLQAGVELSGFYTVTNSLPPRPMALLAPPVLLIALLFGTARGRHYLDALDLPALTMLHVVRIPVELVLYGLYVYRAVPELMTFAGRNWDILSGLSAPVVYYLVFRRPTLGPGWLLAWNFVCLGLLLNIVTNALLAAPTRFQQFAFDQPNVAILHFPFNWLPAVVVPLVLLAHLAAIRQLWAARSSTVAKVA